MRSGDGGARARSPRGARGLYVALAALVMVVALGAAAALPARASAPPATPPQGAATAPDAPGAEPVEAPDSPRASMRQFLALTRDGRYAEAGRYLDLPPRADAGQLARRLKAVLDRHLWVEPSALSPLPFGDPKDGQAVEELGSITLGGKSEPVQLVRRGSNADARWVFSRPTVERVNFWYGRLEDRWLQDLLPDALLLPGPRELLWWQWLALPVLVVLGWVVGRGFSYVARRLLGRLAQRTTTTLDDELLGRMRGPLTFAGALGVIAFTLPLLGLYPPAERFLEQLLSASFFMAIFWAALRVIDTSSDYVLHLPEARENASARSLAPLAGRIAKVMIIIIGIIAVLSELGYPVASLIAGLGIGGVALALAAQKTVENVFGSISIGLDRPFQVGDYVTIDGTVSGTIEAIGLRSTRIRTLDRTLVTIPNGKLADMRVESFSARDRIRLLCTLNLVYGTTAAQMKEIIDGIRRVLLAHPKIWPDTVLVRLKDFGPSSLDVEVMCWFATPSADEFGVYRQEVLLQMIEVVEAAGSSFAFPTQTIHIASGGTRDPSEDPIPGVAPPRGGA